MFKVFSIYDCVKEEFNAPFIAKNEKEAQRSIKQSLQNSTSVIDLKDFKLFIIGSFNQDSGCLDGLELKEIEMPTFNEIIPEIEDK